MNLKESASEIFEGEANAAVGIERLFTQYNLSMNQMNTTRKILLFVGNSFKENKKEILLMSVILFLLYDRDMQVASSGATNVPPIIIQFLSYFGHQMLDIWPFVIGGSLLFWFARNEKLLTEENSFRKLLRGLISPIRNAIFLGLLYWALALTLEMLDAKFGLTQFATGIVQ